MIAEQSGMSYRIIVRTIFGLLLATILVGLGALAVFRSADEEQKKVWLTSGIQYLTGRDLEIGEIVNLELDTRLTLVASDVALNNAAWSEHPQMWRARQFAMELELLPLLRGVVDFSVTLEQPELLLEVNPDGEANWQLFATRQNRSAAMQLYPRYVRVENGRVRYAHAGRGQFEDLTLSRFQLSMLGQKSELTLNGSFNDIPLRLDTHYEGIPGEGRIPVAVKGRLGKLTIDARGLAGEKRLELDVAFNTPSLRFLETRWTNPLPDYGPLSGKFELVRENRRFSLYSVQLVLGNQAAGRMVAEGRIEDLLDEFEVNLDLGYRTTTLSDDLERFGVGLPTRLPEQLDLKAKLTGDFDKLSLREIEGQLSDDRVQGRISGEVDDVLERSGTALNLELDTQTLAALSSYAAITLPETQPIRASTRLQGGPVYRLEGIKAFIRSDQQQLDISGRIGNLNQIQDVALELEGKLFSVDDLLPAASPDIREKLVPLALSGSVRGGGQVPMALFLKLDSPALDVDIQSTLADLKAESQSGLSLSARAEQLSSLGALAGVEAADAGPVMLDATLVFKGDQLLVEDFKSSVGRSDLSGNLLVNLAQGESFGITGIQGQLTSRLINLPELLGNQAPGDAAQAVVGAPSGQVAEPPATDEGKLFSSQLMPVGLLEEINGVIEFHGGRVESNYIELDDLRMNAELAGGVLRISPFKASVGGEPLSAELTLDASVQPAQWRLLVDAKQINMRKVTAKDRPLQEGKLTIDLALTGTGNSAAAVMAGLNGYAGFELEEVTLKPSGFGILTSSVMEQLNPLKKNQEKRLECGAIYMTVKEGIAETPRGLAFKLTNVTWLGKGELDLRRERMLVTAKSRARGGLGISGGQLASLIQIRGPLASPVLELNPKGAITTSLVVGTHVATGGVTLLLAGILDKYKANEDVCRAIMHPSAQDKAPSESSGTGDKGIFKRLLKPLTKQRKEPIIP